MCKEYKVSDMVEFNRLLEREVYSSWWASYMCFGWTQKLAGKYFVWKVNRIMKKK